jgi:acyl-CoA reductase-like NAD-dependent aldehyde dehydrogenase
VAVEQRADEFPFIDGRRVHGASQGWLPSVDPANGQVVGRVASGGQAEVDEAVASGARAQKVWAGWSPDRRGQVVWRLGELLVGAGEELARLDTGDMGRPLRDTRTDPQAAARAARYWAGMADQIRGAQLPITPGHLSYTVREPLGVIAVILPWNGPMLSFMNRVAPALVCGNAVVVKPSEWSARSAGRLAELAIEAGAPEGLLNVVPGGGVVGAALSAHPGVHGISFTGSVPTGRAVAQAAAATFKTVVLEMGGKSPVLVFADSDLDEAVRAAVWGVFANAGQVCCAGTRLLVERSVAAEVVERLAAGAAALKVGDPLDESTQIGPLVSKRQLDRVTEYVGGAVSAGARAAAGGARPSGTDEAGYYVAPTVLANLSPQSPVSREEIFGPVLSVLEFDGEDEAVALANDTQYGLAANIWTSDSSRMLRMAEQLEAGTIWGNTARVMDPGLPFGGFKDSGVGNAYGDGSIDGSTRLKRVSIRYGAQAKSPGY